MSYAPGWLLPDQTEDFFYDTRFETEEEAIEYGVQHDCTHIYNSVTDSFIKIGDGPDEVAYRAGGCYISVQTTDGGYDYGIYDTEYKLLDGGVYDVEDGETDIFGVVAMIIDDLKQPHSCLSRKGLTVGDLERLDYEELLSHTEIANRIEPQ